MQRDQWIVASECTLVVIAVLLMILIAQLMDLRHDLQPVVRVAEGQIEMARQAAEHEEVKLDLRLLGLTIGLYEIDHDEQMPPSLDDKNLTPYLGDRAGRIRRTCVYLGPKGPLTPARTIVARERGDGGPAGRYVLRYDGTVDLDLSGLFD